MPASPAGPAIPHSLARQRFRDRRTLSAIVLALVAVWVRASFLSRWDTNFDADEALVAVQAREILEGRFSLFLPGQSYMGSLQSAFAAAGLALFGNHPTAARLAALLWIVPGYLALLSLERAGRSTLAAGRGPWLLALGWFFPPAVLFLAGAKIRGGNLEGMVLALLGLALLWPRPSGSGQEKTPSLRWFIGSVGAGALFGLAIWTHDQALLLLPLALFALALHTARRLQKLVGFAAGVVAGYLPLWLPRVSSFALGPPGTEGAGWTLDLPGIISDGRWKQVWSIPVATWITQPARPAGGTTVLQWAYAGAAGITVVAVLWWCLRDRARLSRGEGGARAPLWRTNPGLFVSLWLAVATGGALLASPDYLTDPQWFRYTLGLAPLLVMAPALVLATLPKRASWTGAIVLALLAMHADLKAVPGWPTPPGRAVLARELATRGMDRVSTDWELAYALRFFSGDVVLGKSKTPPRFPEVNASVDFAPRAWMIATPRSPRPGGPGTGPPDTNPSEDANRPEAGAPARSADVSALLLADRYRVRERVPDPPDSVSGVVLALDPERTLFAHYEPFPLLLSREYRRDWRGWPYRRPLARFDAIVWQPEYAPLCPIPADRIEAALRSLEESRTFRRVVDWEGNLVLVRRAAANKHATTL